MVTYSGLQSGGPEDQRELKVATKSQNEMAASSSREDHEQQKYTQNETRQK